MDWLWQGLFTNGVWELVLFIVGGGSVIGILRAKRPDWATSILYGIATVACLAVIFFAFTGRAVFSKPQTNASNIEENVKAWTDDLGLGIQRLQLPDTYFAFKITLDNGTPVIIGRSKLQKSGYLQFQCMLSVSPEEQATLAKLPLNQAATVTADLLQTLANFKIGYTLAEPDPQHLYTITLSHGVRIEGLTEASFVAQLDEIDSDAQATKAALLLALQRSNPALTPQFAGK